MVFRFDWFKYFYYFYVLLCMFIYFIVLIILKGGVDMLFRCIVEGVIEGLIILRKCVWLRVIMIRFEFNFF